MRKRDIQEMLKEKPDDFWEEDSKYEHWINYYIPYYYNILGKIVDFNELTYDSIRIVARIKKDIEKIGNYILGGDVIINLDNMPEEYKKKFPENKYEEFNLGLLPKEGNLQGGKKKTGNDWRLDLFIKSINRYYVCGDQGIFNRTKNRNNFILTKNVLDFFSREIVYGDKESVEVNNKEKIYNFCYSIYGISNEMTERLLECKEDVGPEEFRELIYAFWEERRIKTKILK